TFQRFRLAPVRAKCLSQNRPAGDPAEFEGCPKIRADSGGFRVQHGIDKCLSSRFTRGNMFSALQKSALAKEPISFLTIVVMIIAGAIHAGYKNEAILGYAYDFNERWRLQFDWQSGSENSSTVGFTCNVTPDFQFNPALYVNNGPKHDLFGYIVFTYTFHVWS